MNHCLRWDESHLADFVLDYYGQSEKERRKRWYKRAIEFSHEKYTSTL